MHSNDPVRQHSKIYRYIITFQPARTIIVNFHHFFLPDDDECAVSNSCSVNATCTNTPGSFECTCKDGFYGDGMTCTGESRHTIHYFLQ